MSPAENTELPLVKMDAGLLLCPVCGSMDLMPVGSAGELSCDDCGQHSMRYADQCQECGARGVFTSEQVAFPAPGQSPKEAKSRFVRECDNCGFTTA
ncbi:MAG: hypothetical protein JWN72_1180 [Thermoleophilia bacterium]|nr:hypothetical protein [Thermoleophilia bacterium]